MQREDRQKERKWEGGPGRCEEKGEASGRRKPRKVERGRGERKKPSTPDPGRHWPEWGCLAEEWSLASWLGVQLWSAAWS